MNALEFLKAEEVCFSVGESDYVDTTGEEVAGAVIKFTEIQLLKFQKSPLDILEFINQLKKENNIL